MNYFIYTSRRTGTSLQVEADAGSVSKCKLHSTLFNDIPPHEPPLHARYAQQVSSPAKRIELGVELRTSSRKKKKLLLRPTSENQPVVVTKMTLAR